MSARVIKPDFLAVGSSFRALRPAGGFNVILADPPWLFENRSEAGEEKNPNQHYECMETDDIASLPVEMLASDNCALFLWCTWPMHEDWKPVYKGWGFKYAGLAWEWIKYNEGTGKYAFGPGYGTRKNLEPCLLCTRGRPKLSKPLSFFGVEDDLRGSSRSVRDFIQCMPLDTMRAQRREHSRKPDEQYTRIEQMFDGPCVELFSRTDRRGWKAWGNDLGMFEAAA